MGVAHQVEMNFLVEFAGTDSPESNQTTWNLRLAFRPKKEASFGSQTRAQRSCSLRLKNLTGPRPFVGFRSEARDRKPGNLRPRAPLEGPRKDTLLCKRPVAPSGGYERDIEKWVSRHVDIGIQLGFMSTTESDIAIHRHIGQPKCQTW